MSPWHQRLLLPGAGASAGNPFVPLDCISEKATLSSSPRTRSTCASQGFGLLQAPLGWCPFICPFELPVSSLDDQRLLCVPGAACFAMWVLWLAPTGLRERTFKLQGTLRVIRNTHKTLVV